MICKNCGCENLESSRRCVYCGEPLETAASDVSQIMAGFAGVSAAEESGGEEAAKSSFQIVSAVGRLRRTDVPEDEADSAADILVNVEEISRTETVPKSLSDQAAEIVNRAVEKIVGRADGGKEQEPPEREQEEPAAPDGLEAAQAEAPHRPAVPVPESPLNFHLDELDALEAAETEEVLEQQDSNFVRATALTAGAELDARIAQAAERQMTAGDAEETAAGGEESLPEQLLKEPETAALEQKAEAAEESFLVAEEYCEEPAPEEEMMPAAEQDGLSDAQKEMAELPQEPEFSQEEASETGGEKLPAAAEAEETEVLPDAPAVPEDHSEEEDAAEAEPEEIPLLRLTETEALIESEGIAAGIPVPEEEQGDAEAAEGSEAEGTDETEPEEEEISEEGPEEFFEEDWTDGEKRRGSLLWLIPTALLLIGAAFVLWGLPMIRYQKGQEYLTQGNYRAALTQFERSGSYKDAEKLAEECLAKLTEANLPETEPATEPTLPADSSPAETEPDTTNAPDETGEESSSETTPQETEESTPEETTPEETTEESTEESTEEPTSEVAEDSFAYLAKAKAGDIISFGTYEQAKSGEAVEWLVLAAEEDRILVLSRYCLDSVVYSSRTPVTWADSNARAWLNDTFFSNAFTAEEQAKILTVSLENPENPTYHTGGGAATQDRVFLLSIAEIEQYLDRSAVSTTATARALKNGAYTNKDGEVFWWTRTPGRTASLNSHTRTGGVVDFEGESASEAGAIRPAMWLNTK